MHGDAGLAPAVGLIRSLSAFALGALLERNSVRARDGHSRLSRGGDLWHSTAAECSASSIQNGGQGVKVAGCLHSARCAYDRGRPPAMDTAAAIVLIVIVVLMPTLIVGVLFIWAR